MAIYLGIDLGTSSIKSVLLDTDVGKIVSSARVDTPIQVQPNQLAHHEPEALVNAVYECIAKTTQGFKIDGLAISSFAEAGIPLDSSGEPIFPIIAWYDPRSEPQLNQFSAQISPETIESITGQKPGFSFGLFKYLWIKENYPEIIKRMRYWLSTPDFILYKLTGKMYTDFTQASRTMLFDQSTLDWSETILTESNLPRAMLPIIKQSGYMIGGLTKTAAQKTGLAEGTLCCLGGHDHLCGTFASGGYDPLTLVDSSGSSQAVIALTDSYTPNQAIFQNGYVHYHHVTPDQYCIKGGIKAAGKALAWLTRLFQWDSIPSITEEINNRFSSVTNIPIMLPYFQGSGTPHRQPFMQASIFRINLEQSADQVLLAFYEGMGYWLRENIENISSILGRHFNSIIAIGGANQNFDFLKIKATITNLPVIHTKIPEPSAVGAALLAAVGCNTFGNHHEAQQSLDYHQTIIEPNQNFTSEYDHMYHDIYQPTKSKTVQMHKELNENSAGTKLLN